MNRQSLNFHRVDIVPALQLCDDCHGIQAFAGIRDGKTVGLASFCTQVRIWNDCMVKQTFQYRWIYPGHGGGKGKRATWIRQVQRLDLREHTLFDILCTAQTLWATIPRSILEGQILRAAFLSLSLSLSLSSRVLFTHVLSSSFTPPKLFSTLHATSALFPLFCWVTHMDVRRVSITKSVWISARQCLINVFKGITDESELRKAPTFYLRY